MRASGTGDKTDGPFGNQFIIGLKSFLREASMADFFFATLTNVYLHVLLNLK